VDADKEGIKMDKKQPMTSEIRIVSSVNFQSDLINISNPQSYGLPSWNDGRMSS